MRTILVLLLIFFTTATALRAQSWKHLDVDELFAKARTTAFAGNREEARAMLDEILVRSPDYFDVRIFLARTYAWDQQREKAIEELRRVLYQSSANEDALNALIDVEMWGDQYEQALVTANIGLQHYPNSEDFLYKKASILSALKQNDEASAVLNRLMEVNPAHAKGIQLIDKFHTGSLKYSAGLSYSLDLFSRIYGPAQYLAAQLVRDCRWGSAIARINYSDRFSTHGVQAEIDLYPRIANGVYGYFNYGYSENKLFPNHRIGAEIYSKLPKRFEASAGFRYLNFGTGTVTIYTGSVGWYVKDYWLSIRPYITPGSAGTSFSSVFSMRRYFKDGDNYIGFSGGLGFSPDDRRIQSSNGLSTDGIYLLKSQRLGATWQKTFPHRYMINASISMARQELAFDQGNYVWITSPSISLKKRF